MRTVGDLGNPSSRSGALSQVYVYFIIIEILSIHLSTKSRTFGGNACCAAQAFDDADLDVTFGSVGSHKRSRIWGSSLDKTRSTLAPSSRLKAERDFRGRIIASSERAIGPDGRGFGMALNRSSIHGKGRRFGESCPIYGVIGDVPRNLYWRAICGVGPFLFPTRTDEQSRNVCRAG